MAAEALAIAADRTIHREVLPNGLTILTEQMDHIRSVSLGIWLKAGSRNEEPDVNGISHFVEHMVFKGTEHRTAEDIAREVDSIGGNMDAFTGKEMVCFNIKVLDEHLPIAVDVLSDMVLHPIFDETEVGRERGVIIEEIKMDEDNPDSLVHEIFTQNFYKNHALGRPILGTKETVRKFDQAKTFEYYRGKFVPQNLVISAAGHVQHEVIVDLLSREFASLLPAAAPPVDTPPKINSRIILRNKKALEQVQICIGVPSYRVNHEKRFVAYVLNTLLGGGMSSRLFQNVREKQGLVYSIFSELNPYKDTGCLAVYAGTSRESAPKVVQSVLHEFREIKAGELPEEEVKRAKDQLKGGLMLSLESSTARMSNLARQEMYHDRFMGMDEIIAKVQEVTLEDVVQSANEMFRTEDIAVTVLGNLNGLKLTREMLMC
ncbi:MAG TPA: pitrilysin family protein [Candidatus Binatia bacterium]|nr:pitrilysin family protein [Candidatus Binatia bacterium]